MKAGKTALFNKWRTKINEYLHSRVHRPTNPLIESGDLILGWEVESLREIGEHEIPLYVILVRHNVLCGGEQAKLWTSWCRIGLKMNNKRI